METWLHFYHGKFSQNYFGKTKNTFIYVVTHTHLNSRSFYQLKCLRNTFKLPPTTYDIIHYLIKTTNNNNNDKNPICWGRTLTDYHLLVVPPKFSHLSDLCHSNDWRILSNTVNVYYFRFLLQNKNNLLRMFSMYDRRVSFKSIY